MMPTRLVVLLCAAVLAGACAAPASRTADAAPEVGDGPAVGHDVASAAAGAATAEEEDPLVCRPVVRTGTRVAREICMRRSEIEKRQRDAGEMLGEVQRRGAIQVETKN
jgi:hypothetical protein